MVAGMAVEVLEASEVSAASADTAASGSAEWPLIRGHMRATIVHVKAFDQTFNYAFILNNLIKQELLTK